MSDAAPRSASRAASSSDHCKSNSNCDACNVSDDVTPKQATLAIALDYAAIGFAVFPCLERSKAPATGRGFRDATTNPAAIRRWFGSTSHEYNVAIATGIISGVWVLDVDGGGGAIALAQLEADHGQLPPTLTSATATGFHLWFRTSQPLPSTAGRIGRNLDSRGEGGYVLAPPSVHPDGPIYRWRNTEPLAPVPQWLADLVQRKPPITSAPNVGHWPAAPPSNYGRTALERECRALACAHRGIRNHTLNRASFSLHQLVAGGELEQRDVHHGLVDAAALCGLTDDDGLRSVERTIASGARAGLQYPRRRPPQHD